MTKEEIIKSALKFLVQKQTEQGSWGFSDDNDNEISWNEVIEWLEQESIIWIVGKDNCQIAVRNMPIDKLQKICVIIGEEERQPSKDCISRQDAIDTVVFECGEWIGLAKEISKKLRQLPPVTPQPKTGYWIEVTNGRGGHECDICHEYAPSYQSGDEYLTKYCPNCGAKMEVEK